MELRELLMGGPGHDGYAYCADVYCVECGKDIIRELHQAGKLGGLSDDELRDTEAMPQPIFFGESPDCSQHCGNCGEYLYGGEHVHDDDDRSWGPAGPPRD